MSCQLDFSHGGRCSFAGNWPPLLPFPLPQISESLGAGYLYGSDPPSGKLAARWLLKKNGRTLARIFKYCEAVKEKVIPMLVLSGLIFASVAFRDKAEYTYDAVDGIAAGVDGVIQNTPGNANFSFSYFGDTTRSLFSLVCIRYILAPRHLSAAANEYDTVITMCEKGIYGKARRHIINNRRVLMETNYKNYYFLATCGK